MSTTDDVTTQSPGIMMIEGREYALYQGFSERIRIADVKLLWLNTAKDWGVTLFAILAAISAARPETNPWLSFAGLAALSGSAALSVFMDHRAVLITPFAGVEKERAEGSSTLAVTSQSPRVFSRRPTMIQSATVHPEMADFLLTAFSEGQSRRFRQRPRVPAAFRTPRARRQEWASNTGTLVALLALVSIAIAVATR